MRNRWFVTSWKWQWRNSHYDLGYITFCCSLRRGHGSCTCSASKWHFLHESYDFTKTAFVSFGISLHLDCEVKQQPKIQFLAFIFPANRYSRRCSTEKWVYSFDLGRREAKRVCHSWVVFLSPQTFVSEPWLCLTPICLYKRDALSIRVQTFKTLILWC